MSSQGAESFNCAEAWESSSPFLYIKNLLYRQALESGDFNVQYPYDELFNTVTTRILVSDAMKTGRTISLHYKWEPLDETIVVYSAKGKVVYTDVAIHDASTGFVMESVEDEAVMAFNYDEVFWIEESE